MTACARASVDHNFREKIQQLVASGFDWDTFIAACIRHKVFPLVYQNLVKYCPDTFPVELKSQLVKNYIIENLVNSLALVEQLFRILELLKKSGIKAVPFKGPVLAERLYCDFSLRCYVDLDIFISINDAEKAVDILLEKGFVAEDDNLPEGQERSSYLKKVVHIDLISTDRRVSIDLQWDISNRFTTVPILLEDVEARLELVSLNQNSVLSLPAEELLCYLCIHGARHRWLYLDLVCCVSELIRTCKEIDWLYAQRFAEKIHCSIALLLGLSLAHELMQADIPGYMIEKINNVPMVKKLVEEMKDVLFSKYVESKVVPEMFDLFQMKVKDRFYDKVLYVVRVVFIPTRVDLRVFPLPEALGFLRYLLRPARLGWEYFRRRVVQ